MGTSTNHISPSSHYYDVLAAAGGGGDREDIRMPPVDRYYLVYIIFYIQGIGQLFPWNAFVTAGSYYSQRFCGSSHALNFENYFSTTFTFTNLIFQALLVKYAHLVSHLSIKVRIQSALFLLVLIFTSTTVLALFKDVPTEALFVFTNFCVALCGVCTSVLQGAAFGYATRFPSAYTQAMMAGQGLAGLIVATSAIATAASSKVNPCDANSNSPDPDMNSLTSSSAIDGGETAVVMASAPSSADSTICLGYEEIDYNSIAYFASNVFVLLLCMISFAAIETLPFAKYYNSLAENEVLGEQATAIRGGRQPLPSSSPSSSSSAEAATAIEPSSPLLWEQHHHMRRRQQQQEADAATIVSGTSEATTTTEEDNPRTPMLLGLDNSSSNSINLQQQQRGGRRKRALSANANAEGAEEVVEVGNNLPPQLQQHDEGGGGGGGKGVNDSHINGDGGRRERGASLSTSCDGDILLRPPKHRSPPLPPHHHTAIPLSSPSRPLSAQQQQQQQPQIPLDTLCRYLGSPGLAVASIFSVTLAIFPALTVHIVSSSRCQGKGAFYDKAFVPFQFLLFNLFDFFGRSYAGSSCQIMLPSNLWIWSFSRIIFFPLFLLCHAEGSVLPIVFTSDWWPTLFMILFAFSNGLISSLAMMWGPGQVPSEYAETAGSTMVLLLTFGLTCGSFFSFVVTAISSGSIKIWNR